MPLPKHSAHQAMWPQREDFAIEVQVEREGVRRKTMAMIKSGEQAAVTAQELPT